MIIGGLCTNTNNDKTTGQILIIFGLKHSLKSRRVSWSTTYKSQNLIPRPVFSKINRNR